MISNIQCFHSLTNGFIATRGDLLSLLSEPDDDDTLTSHPHPVYVTI